MNASDIAKIAGVSRSTVSRVINNYGNVTEETRKKVIKAIQEYNYVPHFSAQMLAGKTSKIIGLFIVDTKKQSNKMTTSSYFSPFSNGVIDEASKKGYKVLIAIINNHDEFKGASDLFDNGTISGGIFIGSNNNEKKIKDIIQDGYKVVVLEQENGISEFTKAIVVNSDSYGGAYDATKYLIQLGHRSIAHISGDERQWTAICKIQGYRKALEDAGISIQESMIVKGNYTEESGCEATKKLLKKAKPTAIFIANDSMALGVYEEIRNAGFKIPDDISVIGFDDIEVSKYLNPSLTTVRVPLLKMASIATNSLIKAVDQEVSYYTSYNVPVELIVRQSCKSLL
ncbi:MAG: LacI family DNA-binding transcriptional regulator [Clostridia bacterium]|nr:LacI family DNA-binding transcriptional regulator [Clostridia bacterium]